MDLTPYADELRDQLLIAADAGGDEARQLAERLIAPLQSATRLVLLEALAAAAGEITSDLAPGSVEVRLRGREPEFVVTAPPVDLPGDVAVASAAASSTGPGSWAGDAEGGTARLTLRLPEPLKLRIEEAAGRERVSVNSWLVRSLAEVVEPPAPGARPGRRSPSGGEHFTGWARS